MTDRRFRRLSATEALQALYVDFEGQKDSPPVLIGAFRRGRGSNPHVHQDVVDPVFAPLAMAGSVWSLRDVVEKIVQRAERRDRRIVSWSEHDLDVVRTLCDIDPELVARFEARYVNALGVAKWWRNACHAGAKPEVGTLASYLHLIGYAVPDEAGAGHVGETIRLLRPRLERGRPLTDGQRERWRRLIEHNRHDCIGMRKLCIRATAELEARQGLAETFAS